MYNKRLRLTITQRYGEQEFNEKNYDGYAISAVIEKLGGTSGSSGKITIYNLSLDDMSDITNLNFKPQLESKTKVSLFAQDESGLSYNLVFTGDVLPGGAVADFTGAPDIAMNITAITNYNQMAAPSAPISTKKDERLKSLMFKLAKEGDLTAVLSKTVEGVKMGYNYLTGSSTDKAKDLAKAFGFTVTFDDDKMKVCGEYEALDSGQIPEVGADKEITLYGYPEFSQYGISFKCAYNSALQFAGPVKVSSAVPYASGIWKIISLKHNLSSMIPNGPWYTEVGTTYIFEGKNE